MLVFISYPREFKPVAIALDAQLKSRKIATFLDSESIRLSDVWRLEIESNIREAAVFVVLYRPEAAIPGRYFLIEAERIMHACERSLQRIITVIFAPTKPSDLPEFFQNRQILESETEGTHKDERDDHWIDKIVQELDRLNEIKKKIKRRQIVARTALAAGVLIIALLSNKLIEQGRELEQLRMVSIQTAGNYASDGKSLCQSLVGSYGLHQSYVFTAGVDTRSIATHANWKATGCEYNNKNNVFVLKGEELTDFDIEVIINNKYERVATATYVYTSAVSISKDGKLLGRTFETIKNPQDLKKTPKDRNGKSLDEYEKFIDEKIKEVIEIRAQKHKDLRTKTCTPTLGEMGGRITVAFICLDYTRAMVKIS